MSKAPKKKREREAYEVRLSAFSDTVIKQLEAIGLDAQQIADEVAEDVTKRAVEKLRISSPRSRIPRGGKTKSGRPKKISRYADSWTYRVDLPAGFAKNPSYVLFSTKGNLTSLLEFGWVPRFRNGRRGPMVPGRKHITIVESELRQDFTNGVQKRIDSELGGRS